MIIRNGCNLDPPLDSIERTCIDHTFAIVSVEKVILMKVLLMKRKVVNQENVQSQTFGNVERTCSLMIQW